MKRVYEVTVTTTAVVEIDERVLKVGMSKSFARQFYTFSSREEVVEFIARNIVPTGGALCDVDGFADQPTRCFGVVDIAEHECEAVELPPVRVPTVKGGR